MERVGRIMVGAIQYDKERTFIGFNARIRRRFVIQIVGSCSHVMSFGCRHREIGKIERKREVKKNQEERQPCAETRARERVLAERQGHSFQGDFEIESACKITKHDSRKRRAEKEG